MSKLSLYLGQTAFVSHDGQVQATSQATVMVDSMLPTPLADSVSNALRGRSLHHDYWIPRTQRLKITIGLSFTPDLCPSKSRSLELFDALSQSVLSAELWTKLGFKLLFLRNAMMDDTDCQQFLMILSLTTSNHKLEGNETAGYDSHYDNLCNFGPPPTIPSYQLNSLDFLIKFARYNVETHAARRNITKARKSSDQRMYVRLMDAVIRSTLCAEPTRLYGVHVIPGHTTNTLVRLAPATFMPDYAKALSERVHLMDSITKFLFAFKNCHVQRSEDTKGNDATSNHTEAPQSLQSKIEADLWVTMASALENEWSGRRLPPLRLPIFKPVDPDCGLFEDITSFQSKQDPEILENLTVSKDGAAIGNHLLSHPFDTHSVEKSSFRTSYGEHFTAPYQTDHSWRDLLSEPMQLNMDSDNDDDEDDLQDYQIDVQHDLLDMQEFFSSANLVDTQHKLPFVTRWQRGYLGQGVTDLNMPQRDAGCIVEACERPFNERRVSDEQTDTALEQSTSGSHGELTTNLHMWAQPETWDMLL